VCVDCICVAAGALSTVQVKELCRRQLLAKSSAAAASDRCTAAAGKLLSSGGVSTPLTPSQSAVTSPQTSTANIAASPSARSPADEQARRAVVESLRSPAAASSRLTWHIPAGSAGAEVGVNSSSQSPSNSCVNSSPRPPSNSATDSGDGGTPGQQFAVVSRRSCFDIFLRIIFLRTFLSVLLLIVYTVHFMSFRQWL